jgi:hypothetical protein
MQFISNNFATLLQDPTNKFQKSLQVTMKKCQSIIPQNQRWKYINLNPTPPTIRGLIKLHKQGHPIRPTVNWTNTPACKTAKLLKEKLGLYIPLPYAFNIKNPTLLITDLNNIKIDPDLKFASFDINNMYSNIPTTELINIIAYACDQHNIPQNIKHELISLSDTLLAQNYFRY